MNAKPIFNAKQLGEVILERVNPLSRVNLGQIASAIIASIREKTVAL
jgi:hypothetical protein